MLQPTGGRKTKMLPPNPADLPEDPSVQPSGISTRDSHQREQVHQVRAQQGSESNYQSQGNTVECADPSRPYPPAELVLWKGDISEAAHCAARLQITRNSSEGIPFAEGTL